MPVPGVLKVPAGSLVLNKGMIVEGHTKFGHLYCLQMWEYSAAVVVPGVNRNYQVGPRMGFRYEMGQVRPNYCWF